MIVATPTIWIVPRMAAYAPPPMPCAREGFVSKSRLSAEMPLRVTKTRTAASGTTHATAASVATERMI